VKKREQSKSESGVIGSKRSEGERGQNELTRRAIKLHCVAALPDKKEKAKSVRNVVGWKDAPSKEGGDTYYYRENEKIGRWMDD